MQKETNQETHATLPLTPVSLKLTEPCATKDFEHSLSEFSDMNVVGMSITVDENDNHTLQLHIQGDDEVELKPFITVASHEEAMAVATTLQHIRLKQQDESVAMLKSKEGFFYLAEPEHLTVLLQALKEEGFKASSAKLTEELNGVSGITLVSSKDELMSFTVIRSDRQEIIDNLGKAIEIIGIEGTFKAFIEDGTVTTTFEMTNGPELNYVYDQLRQMDYVEIQGGLLVKINGLKPYSGSVLIFPRDETGQPASQGAVIHKTSIFDIDSTNIIVAEEIHSLRRMFRDLQGETE